jgi:hypothetical protein
LRINTLALAVRLPVMYASREYLEAAGLLSYGPNFVDLYRRGADYVSKNSARGPSRAICRSSSAQAPDDATLTNDLAWFDGQIAALNR